MTQPTDTRSLVVSDRDIQKKHVTGWFYSIDIKAGAPFYPTRVNYPFYDGVKTLSVPAFAGELNEYPLEWFSKYETDKE